MKVALIYPPTCDPTAPYIAVPALTGYLRQHGVEVLPIDANLEAWDHLLRRNSGDTTLNFQNPFIEADVNK